jgi:hypothetical protein
MNRTTFERDDGTPTAMPLNPPAIDRLSQVKIPTLILVGDLDTSSVINMERPAEFNRAVLDFLATCSLS